MDNELIALIVTSTVSMTSLIVTLIKGRKVLNKSVEDIAEEAQEQANKYAKKYFNKQVKKYNLQNKIEKIETPKANINDNVQDTLESNKESE